jgi:hypothetical protein
LSQGSLSGARGACPARTALANQRPPTRYPADLHRKCLNCLSTAHMVAICKLPPRCLRCKGFRHLTRDYKQQRKVPPSSSGTFGAPDGRQRRPVQECILGNRPCTKGNKSSAARAVPGAAAPVPGATMCGGGRHRRWRRRRLQHRRKGDDTAAATSVTTDSQRRSTGAAQETPDFTSVDAGAQASHGGPTH